MSTTAIPNHFLIQSPEINATQCSRRSILWNIASKVTLLALAAIAATAAAVLLLGVTLTGATPYLLLGAIFLAPLLLPLSTTLSSWSEENSRKVKEENQIAALLADFKSQETAVKETVYNNFSIDPAYTEEQKDILIARYQFETTKVTNSMQQANEHALGGTAWQNLQEQKAQIKPAQYEALRHAILETGFQFLEEEALPAMLKCALLLQLLKDAKTPPTMDTIGTLHPKPMDQRLFERFCNQGVDEAYLTFQDSARPSLTGQEIGTLFFQAPTLLQQRVFA